MVVQLSNFKKTFGDTSLLRFSNQKNLQKVRNSVEKSQRTRIFWKIIRDNLRRDRKNDALKQIPKKFWLVISALQAEKESARIIVICPGIVEKSTFLWNSLSKARTPSFSNGGVPVFSTDPKGQT